MDSPERFQEDLYTTCVIKAKSKIIILNVMKAEYKINQFIKLKIYLIKVLLVAIGVI